MNTQEVFSLLVQPYYLVKQMNKNILKFLLCISMLLLQVTINANYLKEKIVLFPIKKVELASLVDSTIKRINYITGEEFKKNDTLIELDDKLYKQMYLKAKADVTRTLEAYKYENNIYSYNKKLFDKNAVGEQELEQSRLNMIKALADKEQATANYTVSEIKLDSCNIKAPFTGRVINEIENEHDYVKEGQPVIEIADDNQLLAVMNLPSDFVKNFFIGEKLNFKIDEINAVYSGKIYSISGSINPGSRTIEVKAVLDNKDKELRIGMSGKLINNIKLGKGNSER